MTVCPAATRNAQIVLLLLHRFANRVSEATEICQTIAAVLRSDFTMHLFLVTVRATTANLVATKNARIAPLFLHRFANHALEATEI
jgi:hypothetical protein